LAETPTSTGSSTALAENAPAERAWPDDVAVGEHVDAEPQAFLVDIAGFEGPLDLLLDLARTHKIDLAQISILALADQYLTYIDNVLAMRLDLAADYLVMAAWLAFLKSRLIIPAPKDDGQADEPQAMAARLAFKLQRLQAIRESGDNLIKLPQLGTGFAIRGAPEPLVVETQRTYSDTLVDLLRAYATSRQRKVVKQTYRIRRQPVWSIKEAREVIEKLVGAMHDWAAFDQWLGKYLANPELRRSVRASSFTASLELAREGKIELRQDRAFKPIYIRRREDAA
jgi:segregation and condensation protein A